MGVIRRQSLKYSFVNLVGLIIGGISTLFVYPHALEAYGLMQFLLQAGIVGLPVLALGANVVSIRFFPRFEDKGSGHHGLLPLLLRLVATGCAAAAFVALLAWGWISGHFGGIQREYLWMAAPLAICYTVSVVLSSYSTNFKRIVIPSLLLDFSLKLMLPALLIAVWQNWFSLQTALWLLLCHSLTVTLAIALYIRHLGEWHWKPDPAFLTADLRKEVARFIGFGALGGFALLLAGKIDIIMMGSLSTLKATGVYSIAAYIAAAIDIPTKGLYSASASSVSKYINDDNKEELGRLYRKVSINLLLAGLLLLGAIWISIDSLYGVLPNGAEVAAGKYVVLLIGVSRLVEMGTGLNNYLVYYSRFYGYSLLSLGVMAITNIALNFWLIPRMGLTGAALATLLSVTTYNAVSVGLVWLKFRLFPFTRNTVWALLLAPAVYLLANLIPLTGWPLLDIMVRSGAYFLAFGALALGLRLSPDMNEMAAMARKKLKL